MRDFDHQPYGSLERDLIERVYIPKGPRSPNSYFLRWSSRNKGAREVPGVSAEPFLEGLISGP